MRLIDGEALIAWIKGSQQMTSKMKSLICYIKTMPTSDAVSVVRCGECKWGSDKRAGESVYCEWHGFPWNINGFCSYGERREP